MWLSYRSYLILLAVGLVIGQTVVAAMTWFSLRPAFSTVMERAPDVAEMPVLLRRPMFERYIKRKAASTTRPWVAILGDSEAYGLHLPESLTMTAILQSRFPDYEVVNLASVDGRIEDIRVVLDLLAKHHLHPFISIVELNPTHFGNSRIGLSGAQARVFTGPELPLWVSLATSSWPAVKQIRLHVGDPKNPSMNVFRDINVPDGYLPVTLRGDYTDHLHHLLLDVKALSDHVLVYIAPFDEQSFPAHHLDVQTEQRVEHALVDICHQAGAECLDPDDIGLDRSNFIDIIHLSSLGNVRLADEICNFIATDHRAPVKPRVETRASTSGASGPFTDGCFVEQHLNVARPGRFQAEGYMRATARVGIGQRAATAIPREARPRT